jgi:nucleotide-binding universal stress UspA family protein
MARMGLAVIPVRLSGGIIHNQSAKANSMFKKILVPIDLSESALSKPALDTSVELGLSSKGVLRLVTVETLLPASFMEYVPPEFDKTQEDRGLHALQELSAGLAFPKSNISYAVRFGGIYVEILAEAEEWGADLIVIGSHRPSMATYLIGSNAKTIVRHAKCSVLVIRA